MKTALLPTYRDYLQHLNVQPLASSWDYGMYLKETERMLLFARQSSTVLFLLDYSSKIYPFVDRNSRQILGYSDEAFYEGGLEFTLHNMSSFNILNHDIHQDRAEFLAHNPIVDIGQLRFTMSYRFDAQGESRTILQRNTVIHSTDTNLPVAIFGFLWDITQQVPKGKLIHQIEQLDAVTGDWVLKVSKEYYPDIDKDKLLSKREVEILKWAIEGNSSKQIADKLHLSAHTVNTHRRNMLRKTNCQNSMDLLRYALQYGFL